MAQLVALMSGVVLGGVAEVVGSNLARGKIFTASIGSVDSLYPSVYIYICVCSIRRKKGKNSIFTRLMIQLASLFYILFLFDAIYFVLFLLGNALYCQMSIQSC